MADCPWYVSAAAVRRWMALGGPDDFNDASDELIEICSRVWQRYQRDPALQPRIGRTGGYLYRGGRPEHRITLLVSMDTRTEGAKAQVVDVISAEVHRGRKWTGHRFRS